MKTGSINRYKAIAPREQRGVVLIIALIILVAMTLAGIGMMRSVDTGIVVAGNLAFQKATSHASDEGTSTGYNALIAVAASANGADKAILNFSSGQPCPVGATAAGVCPGNINLPGYSSTPLDPCEVRMDCANPASYTWWTNSGNWAGAPSITVLTDPADPNSPTIATVQYLIHRMCSNANSQANKQTCLVERAGGCSNTLPLPPCNAFVIYRITARAVGARNTVSYTQTLVKNTELIPQ